MFAEKLPLEVPEDEFTNCVPFGQLTRTYMPSNANHSLPEIFGVNKCPSGQFAPAAGYVNRFARAYQSNIGHLSRAIPNSVSEQYLFKF